MAVTDAQYDRILRRLEALENSHNTISAQMPKFDTKEQIRQLAVMRNEELEDLKARVLALENAIQSLQEKHKV